MRLLARSCLVFRNGVGMHEQVTTALREIFGTRMREHEPMAKRTNFRIGGPARWFVDARTAEEVQAAIAAVQAHGVPWCVLGGGSNTLFADAGFDGVVVQMAMRDIRVDGTRVRAGAGAMSAAVARAAGDAGLMGFVWAISLPGTIGGAVRGNAGCFGGETGDAVETVEVLEGTTGLVHTLGKQDCAFTYRHSYFKDHPTSIVLSVLLRLTSDNPARCRDAMDTVLQQRRTTQPHDKPSAGCLFKNIDVRTLTPEQEARLDALSSDSWRTAVRDGRLAVGWVVDRLGLKGFQCGAARISDVHGNFTMNLGGATAADVMAVARTVQERAQHILGLPIEIEVQCIGFSSLQADK
ncbi:MAG: UDP-N-acetylmuramate dehydrogenase [bacterium]|nr:UDP-N-acetylmuramate dehydrogenase [bacterium]